MIARLSPRRRRGGSGMTLVELLVVMAVISLLASLVLVALFGAQEDAKIARTRSQIAKIHELLAAKWEEYETRPVPISIRDASRPQMARNRLDALRELMRLELPDRRSDVLDNPVVLNANSVALHRAYRQRALSTWTDEHQGAECLYLILSMMNDGHRSALEFFNEQEIGDTDDDGMPEILDAWGRPIYFLRWAPGFLEPHSVLQRSVVYNGELIGDLAPDREGDAGEAGDPFDPALADPRWGDYTPAGTNNEPWRQANEPFALFPLVFSAGPDGEYDILVTDWDEGAQAPVAVRYSQTHTYTYVRPIPGGPPRNDPYVQLPAISAFQGTPVYLGRPSPTRSGYIDNIHNHALEVR